MILTSSLVHPGFKPEGRRLRRLDLAGPVGRIEAILDEGSADAPLAALVCHPHPQSGGTMRNKVVYHAMKVLNAPEWGLRLPVLRFNFRGAGLSAGQHDGLAEAEDVGAALDWLESEYARPIVVAGFSFGAVMALRACCCRPRAVRAVAALGLPASVGYRRYDYNFLSGCTLAKLFLSGTCDPFAPEEQLTQITAAAADPKQLVLLPGADHFFTGQLPRMQQALAGWLHEEL